MALRGDRAADGARCLRFHPPTLQLCAAPSRAPRHDASMGGLPGRAADVSPDRHSEIAPTLSKRNERMPGQERTSAIQTVGTVPPSIMYSVPVIEAARGETRKA